MLSDSLCIISTDRRFVNTFFQILHLFLHHAGIRREEAAHRVENAAWLQAKIPGILPAKGFPSALHGQFFASYSRAITPKKHAGSNK